MKSGAIIPPTLCLFARDRFDHQGFEVPFEFGFFSISIKNVVGIFITIALHLQMAFSRMATLTVLILPIQEHEIPSPQYLPQSLSAEIWSLPAPRLGLFHSF